MYFRQIAWFGFLVVFILSIVGGCAPKPSIQEYEITLPDPNKVQQAGEVKYRILGAIVPRGGANGGWWFFKLTGPTELVSAQRPGFDEFVNSLDFHDDDQNPISWKVPKGWTQLPRTGLRFATLRIETAGEPVELAVSSAGGDLKTNVDRWRDQLGLEPLLHHQLNEVLDYRIANGRTVLVLEIAGPKIPDTKMPAGHPKFPQ